MKTKKQGIIAFGYVKEEDGVYTAICVNMGLFGQGKTPEEALKKVIKAVDSYVAYVRERHPDEVDKFLNRFAPANYVEEFKEGINNLRKLMQTKHNIPKQPDKISIPFRSFYEPIRLKSLAKTVSFAQAQ